MVIYLAYWLIYLRKWKSPDFTVWLYSAEMYYYTSNICIIINGCFYISHSTDMFFITYWNISILLYYVANSIWWDLLLLFVVVVYQLVIIKLPLKDRKKSLRNKQLPRREYKDSPVAAPTAWWTPTGKMVYPTYSWWKIFYVIQFYSIIWIFILQLLVSL